MFRGDDKTYRTFLGLIIRHHLVQIAPVAMRAAFCVRDSLSAGRAMSERPAKTRTHCRLNELLVYHVPLSIVETAGVYI